MSSTFATVTSLTSTISTINFRAGAQTAAAAKQNVYIIRIIKQNVSISIDEKLTIFYQFFFYLTKILFCLNALALILPGDYKLTILPYDIKHDNWFHNIAVFEVYLYIRICNFPEQIYVFGIPKKYRELDWECMTWHDNTLCSLSSHSCFKHLWMELTFTQINSHFFYEFGAIWTGRTVANIFIGSKL